MENTFFSAFFRKYKTSERLYISYITLVMYIADANYIDKINHLTKVHLNK